MKAITTIDRNTCHLLRSRLDEALALLSAELGMKIHSTSGNFSSSNFVIKVEFATIGEGGEVNSRESQAFKLLASQYGLKPEDLGKTFSYGGKKYKITGLKPKSYRFPVIAVGENGRGVKFPADVVKAGLTVL